MATYAIDRFEADWVVLEIRPSETFRIPRSWIPSGAREGDVVRVQGLEADMPGRPTGRSEVTVDPDRDRPPPKRCCNEARWSAAAGT